MQYGEDGGGRRKSVPVLQSDFRGFGIAYGWKATALEAEVGGERCGLRQPRRGAGDFWRCRGKWRKMWLEHARRERGEEAGKS